MQESDINIIAMGISLKAWRLRRSHLTLYRIGKEIGMDPHTLARMESGESVHSSALLNYLEFIRKGDPDWDIIKEWEDTKKWLLHKHNPLS